MYRYPDTPHALVAKALAEQLAFQEVAQTDTISEYEAFIQPFPTAPQVPSAEKLAQYQAEDDEKAYLNTQILGKLQQRLTRFQEHLDKLESDPNADLRRMFESDFQHPS